MTRYKAFGSFVAWYIGPCDDIADLRLMLRAHLHQGGRRRQPYVFRTRDDLAEFLAPYYPDPQVLGRALDKAEVVFNSPAHTEQIEQGRGWHSRDRQGRTSKISYC